MFFIGDSAKIQVISLFLVICLGLWLGSKEGPLISRLVVLLICIAVIWRLTSRIASNTILLW